MSDTSDCTACAKEHEAHARQHAAMELPISSIKDGWLLQNGDLYLIVETGPNHTTVVQVPRYDTTGRRKRAARP